MAASKSVVLVVDDAPESIDVLRSVLAGEYQVKAAITGATALEIAAETRPDLILLDVMMPEMDGYEVCRRLKSAPATADIPVIFVTTLSDAPSEARGLSLGAVDYVAKPFVPALVRSRVKSHIALRQKHSNLEALVALRTSELAETRLEIIRRLGRAAEYRDNETGMHVLRMSHICRLLAIECGLSEAEAELILLASPMHDIGEIGIPDRILLKPARLDAAEWEIMKRHTVIGAEILGDHPSEILVTARTVALRHHERWDGTGYPDALHGEQIPQIARIVAVSDVFDALLSVRPYKRAWSVEETLAHIQSQNGKHFEPAVVAALFRVLPECLAIREKYKDDE